MKSNLTSFILLLFTTIFHSTVCTFRGARRGQNEMSRKEYSDYSDYDLKFPSSSGHEIWDNVAASSKNMMSQMPMGTKNNVHKKLVTKPSIPKLKLVPNWPDPNRHLGQVSAVDIDTTGNVVVFHRGDRIWSSQTFTYNNLYNERDLGPILQNTIVVFDGSSGSVINEWGSNMFFMPHGLTVDLEGNVWVTDVALHQVFKFSGNKSTNIRASIVLGIPFTPGNDNLHFCKPTAVAVLTNGDFFVADGYCNSRIIKFDGSGKKLMEWGRSTLQTRTGLGEKPPPGHFMVPHALAIAEDKEMLFVADRENGRIQCFNTSSGVYIQQLSSHSMGHRIFSVAYAPVHGGLLYVVNGPMVVSATTVPVKVAGFVVNLSDKEVIAHFNSEGNGFQNPHDVAVTKDGSQVYVVELNPFKVWKFVTGNLNLSTPILISKIGNTSLSGNISSASQTSSSDSISSSATVGDITHLKIPVTQSKGSMVAMIAAIASVLVVILIAITVIILRIRRGSSKYYDELDTYYD